MIIHSTCFDSRTMLYYSAILLSKIWLHYITITVSKIWLHYNTIIKDLATLHCYYQRAGYTTLLLSNIWLHYITIIKDLATLHYYYQNSLAIEIFTAKKCNITWSCCITIKNSYKLIFETDKKFYSNRNMVICTQTTFTTKEISKFIFKSLKSRGTYDFLFSSLNAWTPLGNSPITSHNYCKQ